MTFTSSTRFARTATVPASSLQTGSFATVTIMENANGDDFIVNLTPSTRITAMVAATANEIKSGQAITITGTANAQGGISATSVSILQGLPGIRPNTTATPGA